MCDLKEGIESENGRKIVLLTFYFSPIYSKCGSESELKLVPSSLIFSLPFPFKLSLSSFCLYFPLVYIYSRLSSPHSSPSTASLHVSLGVLDKNNVTTCWFAFALSFLHFLLNLSFFSFLRQSFWADTSLFLPASFVLSSSCFLISIQTCPHFPFPLSQSSSYWLTFCLSQTTNTTITSSSSLSKQSKYTFTLRLISLYLWAVGQLFSTSSISPPAHCLFISVVQMKTEESETKRGIRTFWNFQNVENWRETGIQKYASTSIYFPLFKS